MNNRLIIISELFWPEEDATSYILTEIANYLNNDHEIIIICGPEFYRKRKVFGLQHQKLKIKRVKDLRIHGSSLLIKLINSISSSFLLFFKSLSEIRRGDTILTITNPPLNIILIAIATYFTKCKSILIVHDVFPDNLVPLKILKTNGVLFKYLSKIFNYYYSRYDTIITLGNDMKSLIINKLNKNTHNVILIPNWSDINLKKPRVSNVNKKLKLLYAGNIGRVQNIEILTELFVIANNFKIELNIIGDGAHRSRVNNLISKESLSNIFLGPSFRRSDQTKILNEYDIAIISLLNGMKGLAYPSKFYGYLASSIPILFIGDKNMDIANEILEFNIGWVLDYNEPDEIVSFFRDIHKVSIEDLKVKSQNCLVLSNKKYNKDSILEKYNSIKILNHE